MDRRRFDRSGSLKRGFTLIELLVTIAIIAILMSVLMPSLSGARRAGRATVCSNNLRQIAVAINQYANSNSDAIVGSPDSSGKTAYFDGKFNGISIQGWDWCGPLAAEMGMTGPGEGQTDATEQDRFARFDWYRSKIKTYSCPENNITAVCYPNKNDSTWLSGKMLSYDMSTQFTSTEKNPDFGGTGSTGVRRKMKRPYRPMISQAGTANLKAIIFEGHRYIEAPPIGNYPDFDKDIKAQYGGMFGGTGPWYNDNKELRRILAPGEALSGIFNDEPDPRFYAFRHSAQRAGAPTAGGQPAIGHLGFLDTHVQQMDDAKATNPIFWFPTGTTLNLNNSKLDTWESTKRDFEAASKTPNFSVP